jgi:hypothetical protein
METEAAVGRRHVLRLAGVVAGGVAAAGLGLATPAMAQDDDALVGSWLVVADGDADPGRTQSVASFSAGGVLISYAINPAGPPFVGTWTREGDLGFRGELWAGYPTGDPTAKNPTARIRAEGRLEGRSIVGSFVIADFDAEGLRQPKPVRGTFRGNRIIP